MSTSDNAADRNPSRRAFLQRSAGAASIAAAMPLLPGLAHAAFAQGANRKLGYALVGLGSLATNQIAPGLQKTELCELRGIVTGTPSKIDTWKQRYNIPDANIYNYETYDRIADNDDIDIIYIVLPNSMHAEYTIRGFEAGKHVLSEKPMANSVADCQRMINAANAAGKKLAVGYRLHFEPNNLEMARLGQEQVFGPVKLVEGSFAFTIGNPAQWRLRADLAGGGPLMDVGIYAVNASCYVTGETPISITAQEPPKTDPVKFAEVEETMFWQATFPSGAVFNGSTSYNASVNRIYFSGNRGSAELQPAYSYGGIKGTSRRGPIEFESIDQFAAEMDDFADCIINDKQTRVPGEMGLRDIKIMMAIYEAAQTGRSITIN